MSKKRGEEEREEERGREEGEEDTCGGGGATWNTTFGFIVNDPAQSGVTRKIRIICASAAQETHGVNTGRCSCSRAVFSCAGVVGRALGSPTL